MRPSQRAAEGDYEKTIINLSRYELNCFIVSALSAIYGENNPSNQAFRLVNSDYFLQFCWQYPYLRRTTGPLAEGPSSDRASGVGYFW
jgi:hypothetical protein